MPGGAGQRFHVGVHDDLQHRLGEGAQEVAVVGLLNCLISAILSSVIGSSSVIGEALQLHPNRQIRWPPQYRGAPAPDSPMVAPARRSPPISTTSMDANTSIRSKNSVLKLSLRPPERKKRPVGKSLRMDESYIKSNEALNKLNRMLPRTLFETLSHICCARRWRCLGCL